MQLPIFETPRLLLSALTQDDTEAVFSLFSNPLVVQYYDLEAFTEESQASKIIQFFQTRFNDGVGIRWAIRLKESGHLIGTCGFNSWNAKMKNTVIGYDLMPEYWRNGYTTEAVARIIQAAFDGELSCGALHRIQADTVPDNKSSEYVLTRLGFKEEGIRRDSGFWQGQFHNLKCFALLKSEYNETSL